jgi:hypothetical protein
MEVTLAKLTDTNGVILGSKDMRRFHPVERLDTGTDSYGSNLVLSILALYP